MLAVFAGAGGAAHAAADGDGPMVGVIVRFDAATGAEAAQRAITRLGGSVDRSLGIIHAFAARLPERAVDAVRSTAGVAEVTLDATVRMKGAKWNADADQYPMASLENSIGAMDFYT
jgi:hypothetical protein